MISDAIALYELLARMRRRHKVLSALFDADGRRLRGEERVEVEVYRSDENPNCWWYSVSQWRTTFSFGFR